MDNTKIYAEILEDEALEQFNAAMALECNVQGALMPDAHTGYTLPIGAVIKSKGVVFPAYVGYDIGCGMMAINLDITKDGTDLDKLKSRILNEIPIGFNRHDEPYVLKGSEKHLPYLQLNHTILVDEGMKNKGTFQLGTLGGGNHFIEIGESSKNGTLWVVVHSGSRGFGHGIAKHYMNASYTRNLDPIQFEKDFAKGKEIFKERNPKRYEMDKVKYVHKMMSKVRGNIEGHYGLDIDSDLGQDYISDMDFCLGYALHNRSIMCEVIVQAIMDQKESAHVIQIINRNHNHAEVKDGFVIHRKGATHAEKDMYGVIPGNMRDGSFIVKGKGNEESICSSSHGAGRVMSRRKAKENIELAKFHEDMVGIVTNHTDDTVDESPDAYKNIFEVMSMQSDLVEVIDRSIPILNIKG